MFTYLYLIIRNRGTVLAIGVYCMVSVAVIGFDELFSLWAATQPKHGEMTKI